MTERARSSMLALATVCLMLLLCEFALRLWDGVPPWSLANFRADAAPRIVVSRAMRYDAMLGWSLKDNLDTPSFHTSAYGIRRNGTARTELRPGNILVVGGSYTEGIEIADEQTWPAQLERLTGRAVDNAAVAGYALDQIVLRAEQLLAALRPRVVLVAVGDSNIGWNGYSVKWGGAKPFFTVEQATLLVHNVPPPPFAEGDPWERVKIALGYSHLVDRVMSSVDPDGWYARDVRIRNDPVDVGCRLLGRLKQQAERFQARTVLVSELKAEEIMSAEVPPEKLRRIEECAARHGYRIVDTLGAFQAAYKASPGRLYDHYVVRNGRPLHFSELGSRRVAEIVAAALAAEFPRTERPSE